MREIFWRARFVNHDSSVVHRGGGDFSLARISRELLENVHGFPRMGGHIKDKERTQIRVQS